MQKEKQKSFSTMNEENSDQEYNPLLRESTNNEGMNDPIPNQNSNRKSRADLLKRFLSKAESSVYYNIFKVFVPVSKFVTTILVLTLSEGGCYRPLGVWFFCMLINDVIAIVLRALVLYNLIEMNRTKRSSTIPDLLIYQELEPKALKYQDILYGSSSLILMSSERFKRRERIKQVLMVIWWLKVIFYCLLIIYGQAMFVRMPIECRRSEYPRAVLALIYLIFGYLYLCMPILFLFIGCFVMGRSSWGLVDYLKKVARKSGLTKSEIGKLEVEKYVENSDLPGFHECSICTRAYKEGEDIVKLKCDPSHHFHKQCAKKEFKKKKCCPICEKRINKDSASAASSFKSEISDVPNESLQ